MWKNRLRALFSDSPAAAPDPVNASSAPATAAAPAPLAPTPAPRDITRHSHALEQMLHILRDHQNLQILDLGEVNQDNVAFLTSLGHRLYSEDLLRTVDSVFGEGDPAITHASGSRQQEFFEQALAFPQGHFDAALVWDSFEYLAKPLLEPVMYRLLNIVRPGGVMLACFHADARDPMVPFYSYRIQSAGEIQVHAKAHRRLVQPFNNRTIEQLFQPCSSVKFFLTRDSLREVLVRR